MEATNNQDDEANMNDSILLQQTSYNDKTILDYRDFLGTTLDYGHSRSSSAILQESFVTTSGIEDIDPKEIDQLGRHGHSDLDTDEDDDPYFEYNQCHEYSKLELKDLEKEKVTEINLSSFFTKK